jgi:hypothetical protein
MYSRCEPCILEVSHIPCGACTHLQHHLLLCQQQRPEDDDTRHVEASGARGRARGSIHYSEFIYYPYDKNVRTVQYSTVQYSIVQCSAAQHGRRSAAQHSAIQCSTAPHRTASHRTAQYNAILRVLEEQQKYQYSTTQYNTEHYSTKPCNPVQYNTIQRVLEEQQKVARRHERVRQLVGRWRTHRHPHVAQRHLVTGGALVGGLPRYLWLPTTSSMASEN